MACESGFILLSFFPYNLIYYTVTHCKIQHKYVKPSLTLSRTFANNLDPGQARCNISPYLDPNCFTLKLFLKDVFEKVNF